MYTIDLKEVVDNISKTTIFMIPEGDTFEIVIPAMYHEYICIVENTTDFLKQEESEDTKNRFVGDYTLKDSTRTIHMEITDDFYSFNDFETILKMVKPKVKFYQIQKMRDLYIRNFDRIMVEHGNSAFTVWYRWVKNLPKD